MRLWNRIRLTGQMDWNERGYFRVNILEIFRLPLNVLLLEFTKFFRDFAVDGN